MSVEYLCHKYETLADQLRREEFARESVERHGMQLEIEVESAEIAATKRSNALVAELSGQDASLGALRVCADDAARRATAESAKAREEQASEGALEQECAILSERCRSEASRCEQALSRLASQDREAAQDRCEHGEVGRRLREVQADTRVSLEDLRIAQQRALLVRSELQTLEASIDAAGRAREEAGREAEAHGQQLRERRRKLCEQEARLEALVASMEASRAEAAAQDRRLSTLHEEERSGRMQLAAVQQNLLTSQQEVQTVGLHLHAELEATSVFSQELGTAEHRHACDASEAAANRRSLTEAEAAHEAARRGGEERRLARETLTGRLARLAGEEEGHAAAAGELRRARHAEDLAFEDVQSELQIAFRRRESLGEDVALGARAREQLQTILRRLRPEVAEAEERCRDLGEQLAQRARDLEDEILQQRHCQEEVAAVSDSIAKVQREEARLEAELHHAAIFSSGAAAIPGDAGRVKSVSPVRGGLLPAPASAERRRPSDPGSLRVGGATATPLHALPLGPRWPATPRRASVGAAATEAPASRAATSCSPGASGRHRGPASQAPWASPSPAPRLLASRPRTARLGGSVGRLFRGGDADPQIA